MQSVFGIGAGIAAGLALPSACILPLLIVVLTLNESREIKAANHTLMLLFLVAIFILFESARLSRVLWKNALGVALGISVAYAVATAGAISTMETHQERTGRAQRMIGYEALYAVRSLSACLVRYQADHPQAGFPHDLNTPSTNLGCTAEISALHKIPLYRLSYETRPDSAGRITDFDLTFIPKKRGTFGADPIMSDRRGMVFTWYTWSYGGRTVPRLEVWSSDLQNSDLWEIRTDFEKYLQQYGMPNSFDDVFGKIPNLHGWQKADNSGRAILEGAHLFTYAFSVEKPPKVQIAATCQSYGEQCIRSYLADFDGTVHFTALPRAATPNDSVLNRLPTGEPCEGPSWPSNPPCDSVEWPAP